MGARWYNSELGRFMSPDPVGFNAGNTLSFNRYLYGNNNPYTFYDPDGEYAQLVIEMTEDAIVQVSGVINDIKNGNYESAAVSVVSIGLAVLVARRLPDVSGLLRQGAKNSDKVIRAVKKKGLTTPKKYFGSKSKPEVKEALEKKYGPPKSSREHADTYYNDKTKRSYNVHEEPGHNGGKPHVDIRRRGRFEERKYDLKE